MTDIQAFWVLFWLCAGWCGICAVASYIYHRARAKVKAWVSGRRRRTEAERAADEFWKWHRDLKCADNIFDNVVEVKDIDITIYARKAATVGVGESYLKAKREYKKRKSPVRATK